MSARQALREVLTGAVLRSIAGIRDAGELLLARFENIDGGDHVDTTGDKDVWVHVRDVLRGVPMIGRLFIPAGILFNLPAADETCMVARAKETGGPGAPYVLHGDGGDPQSFPSWIASKAGLFTRKVLRLESAGDAVEIQSAGSADVVLNGGDKKVARVTDRVRVGMLTATAGPWPVQFVFTPLNADGTPGAPTPVSPSAVITAVISTEDGAARVKA